jgi:hypothetical protein
MTDKRSWWCCWGFERFKGWGLVRGSFTWVSDKQSFMGCTLWVYEGVYGVSLI